MPSTGFSVRDQKVIIGSSESIKGVKEGSVDLVVTSPPYWNLKDYGHEEQIGAEPYDRYLERLSTVWSECYRLGSDKSVMAINIGNRRHKKVFYPIGLDIVNKIAGWELWDIVIWYVPNALPQPNHYMERLFDNKFEFVLIFTKDGNTDYEFHKPRVPQKYRDADPRSHNKNPRGRCLGNIIRIPAYKPPNVKQLGYHAAAFPEELVAFLLECYTSPGSTVLDPFLGSGTTLKVANHMGRKGVGVELNPAYADLIRKRIDEPFEMPDWKDLDIIHSSTTQTGMTKSRKVHLVRDIHGDDGQSAKADQEQMF